MPKATVSQNAVRKELRTLEGGWVSLKPLSFDQMLERRDNALRASQTVSPNAPRTAPLKTDLQTAQKWARAFEFKHCIVDHNLTDEQDNKLDFTNEMTLQILDPKVGAEIEQYIDELNQEDEDLEGFTSAATSLPSRASNGQRDEDLTETP